MPLERYVRGVVAGELAIGALPPGIAQRMLALQAIVARTWAAAHAGRHAREGFDVCTTTHCQVLREDREILAANVPPLDRAVDETAGVVLVFDGRPIDAVFHADCGGETAHASSIWGGEGRPYLQAVADPACGRNPASAWTYRVGREALRGALNAYRGTTVGGRLDDLQILADGGGARLVSVHGEQSPLVTAEELRGAVTRQFGARTVRSPRFSVRRDRDQFVFAGRGFGHGVGLCQHGAMARLREGAGVDAVLLAYYRGARLANSPARLSQRTGHPAASAGQMP